MGEDKAEVGKRQFGAGHFLRPQLVHFYNCHDVLIEGVTLQKSPFWTVHLAYCTNAIVRGVHVLPGVFALPGSNDDAIDIECCSNVIVEDSLLESYDDSVAIKAGRGRDAWGGPACSNVIVRRCTARTRTDGFMIGSEMSGGVRNVLVEDCRVEQARSALAFRSNTDRGGFVENVAFRRIAITNCGVAIRVASDFQNIVDHPYPPRYRNFRFSEITCTNASERGIHIVGLPRHDVRGIRLEEVEIKTSAMPSKIEEVRNLRMRAVRVNGVLEGPFDH
jgi:polygalacturonase